MVKKFLGWSFFALFLLATTGGLWVPLVLNAWVEKHYDFDDVQIEVVVMADGSLDITETRTFDFRNGPFTFAYFTVEDEGYRVRGFSAEQVNPDGTTTPVDVDLSGSWSDEFNAEWTFDPAEDERRTFRFHYTYACAVDVYDDTAHLNWKFIGTGWDQRTEQAQITVDLPGHADGRFIRPETCEALDGIEYDSDISPNFPQVAAYPLEEGLVRAWGHGPLNGEVELVDPQRLRFHTGLVDPNSFVEGSILFPADTVPLAPIGSTGMEAPTAPTGTRDPTDARAALHAIIEQEEKDLAEANTRRAQHDQQMTIASVMLAGLPPVLIALVVLSRLRDRVPGVPRDLPEPPEDDPVKASFVWRKFAGGGSTTDPQRAQLLRLVRVGAVEVRTEGLVTDPKDITLHKRKEPEELTGADASFMQLLFGSSEAGDAQDEVSVRRPKRMPPRATGPARHAHWLRVAEGDETKRTLVRIEKSDARFESVAAFIAAGWVATFGFWATAFGEGGRITLWLIPYALVLLVPAIRMIRGRLDPDLRERVARLGAFRHYLLHFSSLPDAPAAGVVIWEEYMEWAVALGVAERVEKQVRVIVPQQELANSPWVPSSSITSQTFLTSMASVAGPLAVAGSASPSPSGSSSGGFGSSSSSGGGGGFSGGGGGGGGGTGGGAG